MPRVLEMRAGRSFRGRFGASSLCSHMFAGVISGKMRHDNFCTPDFVVLVQKQRNDIEWFIFLKEHYGLLCGEWLGEHEQCKQYIKVAWAKVVVMKILERQWIRGILLLIYPLQIRTECFPLAYLIHITLWNIRTKLNFQMSKLNLKETMELSQDHLIKAWAEFWPSISLTTSFVLFCVYFRISKLII